MNEITKLSTDQLYKALPSFINVGGELYALRIYKTNKTVVEYRNYDGKCLNHTFRTGKDLKTALRNMVVFLNDFGFYDKMASGNRLKKVIRDSYPESLVVDDLVTTAKKYSIRCDTDTNHLYDGKPYIIHTQMVYDYAVKYSYLLNVDEVDCVYASCFTHDLIEDCRQTYNDVRTNCGEIVADITFALTNEKGKTRKHRANDSYYKGIKMVKNAPFVKICDRLANVLYSKQNNSPMFEVYKKEHKNFKAHFVEFQTELKPMFDELDALFM